jgi:3-hydroxybutyryl-CoA dehydrogenase
MSINSINILGLGNMGEQISALLLIIGYSLSVYTSKENQEAQARIERNIKLLRRSGIGSPHDHDIGEINIIANIKDLSPSLTIECLSENLEIKKSIIHNLPYDIKLGSNDLLTNTSSFSPKEIHTDAIGLHFFNPISKLKFFEFCDTSKSSSSCTQELINKLNNVDFIQINVQQNRGYIANFFLFKEIASLIELYEVYGYSPEDIDLALSCLGKNLTFERCIQLLEIIGIDVANQIFYNFSEPYNIYHPKLLTDAESLGILGKKNRTTLKELLTK